MKKFYNDCLTTKELYYQIMKSDLMLLELEEKVTKNELETLGNMSMEKNSQKIVK